MSKLSFPVVDEPLVSVVILTYGNWPLARRTLEALLENTEPVYELVLVDNASPDDTPARLTEEVEGANLILNDANVGFGPGNNQGVAAARAPYVCLLNSDAIVQPGWLDPLLEQLTTDPSVGAVVPMLLNENGTIQEAGSAIDSTGLALALGAGEPATALAHRFRRSVDFGSGACMLLRRDEFEELGGFDPAYGVAYFEDVDLCFKLKRRGLKTMYEPRSQVVHVLHGSGTSAGAQRMMLANRGVFYSRWAERLATRPTLMGISANERRLVAARDAEVVDRILVIDDRVPFHDRGSGDPRMAKLLAELVELWPEARITLAAADGTDVERYAPPLLERGVEIVAPPVDWGHWFESRVFHYSAVIVSRGQNVERFAGYLQATQPQALQAFDTEALSFRRLERLRAMLEDPEEIARVTGEAVRTRLTELRALADASLIIAVSEEEASLIGELAAGTPTFVLPGYVEPLPDPPGFAERRGLLYFGGFLAGPGSPNEDSVRRLVADVMPLLWERDPALSLKIVGADPTPAVQALAGERVEVVGFVNDPNPWLAEARVLVNPIRFGAGVNLKLLDAIAAGLPFVTTGVGSEGLALGELGEYLVGETAEELATLVHALYTNEALWQRAHEHLLESARTRFSRKAFRETLAAAMSHLGIAPPEGVFRRAA